MGFALLAAGLGGVALVRANLDPAVTPPKALSAQDAAICTSVIAGLPNTVGGQERRGTRPDSPFTAAYGSPAITVRCGVRPPGPTGEFDCRQFGDAWWLVVGRSSHKDTVFLTFDTRPAVEMKVPDAYSVPPVDSLSTAVQRLNQPENPCP